MPPTPFSESCALCHGGLGQGGVGGKLRDTSLPLSEFRQRIRQGGAGMPPFAATRLPDGQIEAIYHWLKETS